jgi:hypothetical protein
MRPLYARELPALVWSHQSVEFLSGLADTVGDLYELEIVIEEVIGRAVLDREQLRKVHFPKMIEGEALYIHRTAYAHRTPEALWLVFAIDDSGGGGPVIHLLLIQSDE